MNRRKKSAIEELQENYENSRSISAKYDVSHIIIENYAHEKNVFFKYPIEILYLNGKQKKKRLEYCNIFCKDTLDQFVFCDESAFQIFRNNRGK